MDAFYNKMKLIFEDVNLRRRIWFTLGALVIFRLLAAIPIPGVNTAELNRFLNQEQFFGFLNIFSGGGLSNLSIIMLGVGPFITASIIMQLLTLIFPSLKEMYHEDGEVGRRKIAQYSRMLTVPLAAFQGYGLLALLKSQGVIGSLSAFDMLINIIVVTAGAILLMWIGELISEYGIGNGVSFLIFAGIVSRIPAVVFQVLTTSEGLADVPMYIAYLIVAVIVIAAIVFMTEGERPVPVTYAKRVRGMKVYGGISTYLPIRVNNAGVMPIIFAMSLLLFPQMIVKFLANMSIGGAKTVADFITTYFFNNQWIYGIFYFLLVVLFTYFYSAITFDPERVSENLQKSGAFIPGVRPGRPTAEYIASILTRLTLVGAIFLGVVAMLPLIIQGLTGTSSLAVGGTSILIVVSVALELVKQVNAQVTMREY
jgi:preprotein translocase subunit SecY